MTEQNSPISPWRQIIRLLSHQDMVFFAMPPLMVLLVLGTVSQRWLGLYEATRIFFFSPFVWIGPIPIPGAPCWLAVILLCLVLKFLFHSRWRWARVGIHLAHLGVLILLLGGLVTALDAQEGSLTIFEQSRGQTVYDFHQRELRILRDDTVMAVIPQSALQKGKPITAPNLPFQITLHDNCRDCGIVQKKSWDDAVTYQGMAKAVDLIEQPSTKPNEAKIYGLIFDISGAEGQQDGRYLTFDVMPKPTRITMGGHTYALAYSKSPRDLPFSVELKNFSKAYHPGTDKAKAYASDVIIHDGAVNWPARIAMNEPLRYKGYTLFQSSYIESDAGTATVLSVVENSGWLLPYLGTIIMSLGLLLHCWLAGEKKKEGKSA